MKTFYFSFFYLIWHILVLFPNTNGATKMGTNEFLELVERANPCLLTIESVYSIDESSDNGKNWKHTKRQYIKYNIRENSLRLYEKEENGSITSERFWKSGVSSEYVIQEFQGKKFLSGTIEKQSFLGDWDIEKVVFYNNLIPGFPLIAAKRSDKLTVTAIPTSYDNIPAVEIKDNVPPRNNTLRHILTFDKDKGVLLRRVENVWVKKENAFHEKLVREMIPSQYFYSNGLYFPGLILYKYPSGRIIRYTIDKEKTKLNEEIPRRNFIATFPPDCEVTDEINNRVYRTPAIGNANAEKEIANELDKLYENSKK
jgi:hypothetical protein